MTIENPTSEITEALSLFNSPKPEENIDSSLDDQVNTPESPTTGPVNQIESINQDTTQSISSEPIETTEETIKQEGVESIDTSTSINQDPLTESKTQTDSSVPNGQSEPETKESILDQDEKIPSSKQRVSTQTSRFAESEGNEDIKEKAKVIGTYDVKTHEDILSMAEDVVSSIGESKAIEAARELDVQDPKSDNSIRKHSILSKAGALMSEKANKILKKRNLLRSK